jgi:hypothetical protein
MLKLPHPMTYRNEAYSSVENASLLRSFVPSKELLASILSEALFQTKATSQINSIAKQPRTE